MKKTIREKLKGEFFFFLFDRKKKKKKFSLQLFSYAFFVEGRINICNSDTYAVYREPGTCSCWKYVATLFVSFSDNCFMCIVVL